MIRRVLSGAALLGILLTAFLAATHVLAALLQLLAGMFVLVQ